jgi:hypothetical protein
MEEQAKALLMEGNLYLDFLDADGNSTGFKVDIEVSELTITQNDPNDQTVRSRKRGQIGQRVAGVFIGQGTSCTIVTPEAADRDIIAAQFLGTGSDVAITGTSVTDESVTLHGTNWAKLPHINIDDQTPATGDDGDAASYTEGTDFEINHRLGLIRRIEGGGIADGDEVFLDYDYLDASGHQVEGSTVQQVAVRVLLDGTNLMTNERVELYADKLVLRPGEGFNMMAEEPAAPQFEGEFEKVGSNPLFRYRNLGAEA